MHESVRTFTYDPLPYDRSMPAMLAELVVAHTATTTSLSPRPATAGANGSPTREADVRRPRWPAGSSRRVSIKGVRVGILAPNGPDFVVAFLAVTRIGAVAVPINTFFQPRRAGVGASRRRHPHLCCRSITCSVRTSCAGSPQPSANSAMLGWRLTVERLPQLRNVFPLGEPIGTGRAVAATGRRTRSCRACESTVRPTDDLVVIYTSGSTSDPKGDHPHARHGDRAFPVHRHPARMEAAATGSTSRWRSSGSAGWYSACSARCRSGVTILTEHRFDAGDVLAPA